MREKYCKIIFYKKALNLKHPEYIGKEQKNTHPSSIRLFFSSNWVTIKKKTKYMKDAGKDVQVILTSSVNNFKKTLFPYCQKCKRYILFTILQGMRALGPPYMVDGVLLGNPLEYNLQCLSKMLHSLNQKFHFQESIVFKIHICTTKDCSRIFSAVLILIMKNLEKWNKAPQTYFYKQAREHFCSHKKLNCIEIVLKKGGHRFIYIKY